VYIEELRPELASGMGMLIKLFVLDLPTTLARFIVGPGFCGHSGPYPVGWGRQGLWILLRSKAHPVREFFIVLHQHPMRPSQRKSYPAV
jgi:hypothetical protein